MLKERKELWILQISLIKMEVFKTLHLILEDKDGYFIGTSPPYIVQKTLEKQELNLPYCFQFHGYKTLLMK